MEDEENNRKIGMCLTFNDEQSISCDIYDIGIKDIHTVMNMVFGAYKKFASKKQEADVEPVTNLEADPYLRSNPFVSPKTPENSGNAQLEIMGYKIFKKKVK